LQVDGDPAGTIYLDQGQITCARASWIPDIGARLLGTLQPPAESLDVLAGADEPDRDIGTYLVQRNYLTIPDLARTLRSVVVDTLIALTALADEDAFISDIRFAPAGAHWAAAFSCLEVDSVLAEAAMRSDRMARHHLGRTTPIRLHELGRPSAVLTRPQWALACAIDGAASPQDLAWRCGLALYEAIEHLSHLIAAGLCQADPPEASPLEPPISPPAPLTHRFAPAPIAPPAPSAPRSLSAPPALSAPSAPPALSAPSAPPAPFAPPALSAPPAPVASREPIALPVRSALPAPRVPSVPPGPPIPAGPSDSTVPLPAVPSRRAQPPVTLAAPPAILAELSAPATDGPASPDLLRRVLDGLRRNT
jgi:hypothetical protein